MTDAKYELPADEATPALAPALGFMRAAEPADDVEYRWVADFAKDRWAEYRDESNRCAERADSIIKYLGGGTGLLAITLLSRSDSLARPLIACALPSLFFAIVAILVAVYVRRPWLAADLPSVENAKQYADKYKTEARATGAFLGQWHLAIERVWVALDKRGDALELAFRLYVAAIGLLALPLLYAIMAPR